MPKVKVHRIRYATAALWSDPLDIACEICGADSGEECSGSDLVAVFSVATVQKEGRKNGTEKNATRSKN
jgi:hypothetical protein